MPTIVYRYGLRAPIDGAEIVEAQLRAAHRYRNTLVEIERRRRDRLRAIEAEDRTVANLHAEMQRAQEMLDEALEAARLERKRSGKDAPSRAIAAERREQIRESRAALKESKREWREARIAARDSMAPRIDEANEQALAERKAARAACGVYWGTYQLIEDADGAARKAPLWLDGEPNNPRFARWDGNGAVSVQIADGMGLSLADITGGNGRQLRWEPRVDKRGESRRRALRHRATLSLRVGSHDDGSPVWAQWPMIQHRPMPLGARVKRATVHRQMIGPRATWFLTLTLCVPEHARRCGNGEVAIDVGWRLRPDGSLRVAQTFEPILRDEHEYTLPQELRDAILRADTLRSTRDQNFDEMRRVLAGWIRETRSMPGWFLDATASLSVWRSPARLAALARDWRETRFSGDNAMFDAVEGWRRQDKHLWCWETSQRAKSLARRRDYYRCIAAKLAENFETVILEDFDLRAVARIPHIESGENYIEKAVRNRTLAAVSELRGAIVNAFRMHGGSVQLVDPSNTTRECHVCGVVEAFDAASKLRHTCANGHEWDQDANAAHNIYERWRRAQDTATARSEEESVPSEARWARAKRMKRERDERMDRSKDEAV